MNDCWLSVAEICTYLGIKRDTVYKWINKKQLSAYRAGKLWKFKASEVDEWVKNGDSMKVELYRRLRSKI